MKNLQIWVLRDTTIWYTMATVTKATFGFFDDFLGGLNF